MHELSIAQSLIETACETAARDGADCIRSLRVRIGALSGVVKEALLFSFALAAEGSACEGATLEIEEVPVTVMCPRCRQPRTLANSWLFSCPQCGTATPEILTGRELDLISMEVDEHAAAHS
jgi:hydrogenase nickel incorporation protein HypA/HybF